MEFFGLIGLLVFVTLLMPWINHARISRFKEEMQDLHGRLKALEHQRWAEDEKTISRYAADRRDVPVKFEEPNAVDPQPEEGETLTQPKEAEVEVIKPVYEAEENRVSLAEAAQNAFEKNIATKLTVWIGSVSLIFAAYFLVKYSIEFGLLGPVARVSLGGLFGISLFAAGEFVSRRPDVPNVVRLTQGIIGAGLVSLYVSLYAAINLYGLISPFAGFVGMAAVTAVAVVSSLRYGQPIAVFGLVGGLLTPALVGSEEPNAAALFTYLFLLFSGLFVVLVHKGWWLLAVATLVGVFCWSAFWFVVAFSAADAFVLVLFAVALAVVVLAATGKRVAEDRFEGGEVAPVHILNATAIGGGFLIIMWLGFRVTLGLFDWSMLGLFSMALMTLAFFKPSVYKMPLIAKCGATLFLYFTWAGMVPLTNAVAVLTGLSAIYIGGSAFLMRQVGDPRLWGLIQVSAALALYLISYWVLDLPTSFMESFSMFWGVTGLVLASLCAYQAMDIRDKYAADNVIKDHLLAMYCLASSAFISISLAIELPGDYLPMAIAAQVLATAWVFRRTEISVLKSIMFILTLVFVALNYEQLFLFAHLIIGGFFGETPSASWLRHVALDAPVVKLGVPALFFYVSMWLTTRIDKEDSRLIHALFGAANLLVLALVYYIFRAAVYDGSGHIFSSELGFIERGLFTIILGCAGMAMIEFIRRHDMAYLKPWGKGIFRMAMIRYVYFDLFMMNPYWRDDQMVGDMVLLNGVTMTYGFGLLAVLWAMRNRAFLTMESKSRVYGLIGFASLFALTSLNVRQYFQGSVLEQGFIEPAELYAYSIVWLLTGLAILAAGIRFENKAARMASIAFIALAVCKVFLYDAAGLDGLYRVFSFLGLGVSLLGLSYFYSRFVFANEKGSKEAEA